MAAGTLSLHHFQEISYSSISLLVTSVGIDPMPGPGAFVLSSQRHYWKSYWSLKLLFSFCLVRVDLLLPISKSRIIWPTGASWISINWITRVPSLWTDWQFFRKDYVAFEQSVNPYSAERLTSERSRDYMTARRVAKEYEACTRGLNKLAPCVPPTGSAEEYRQVWFPCSMEGSLNSGQLSPYVQPNLFPQL